MKIKTENKHETPEQMMERISVEVEDDLILEERAKINAKRPESPFNKLLVVDGKLTSKEKAEKEGK